MNNSLNDKTGTGFELYIAETPTLYVQFFFLYPFSTISFFGRWDLEP
ncbi:MAG: hypothetical protein JWO03_2631 [Bacteroidetes bacterium]|nr:hypothetical protein [Bacteroidota bacterium]